MGREGGKWTVQICHILLIQGANRVETALPYVRSLKRVNKFGFGLRQEENIFQLFIVFICAVLLPPPKQ